MCHKNSVHFVIISYYNITYSPRKSRTFIYFFRLYASRNRHFSRIMLTGNFAELSSQEFKENYSAIVFAFDVNVYSTQFDTPATLCAA